jgi:hypothetical protein
MTNHKTFLLAAIVLMSSSIIRGLGFINVNHIELDP